MILTVLYTVCLLFGTPYQTMCLFNAGPGNFIILYLIPNAAVWIACHKMNEWMNERLPRSSWIFHSVNQPLTICYLLLSCPRLSVSPQATCPFRDEGLTLPAAGSPADKRLLGIVSPKGSCFVQCHPLSHDGLHPVHGGIKPWPQFPKCRQLWGIVPASELPWVSAEAVKTTSQPNPASFFPFLRG